MGIKQQAWRGLSQTYQRLDDSVKSRLVVENDERLYTISDCMALHERTGIPLLFDVFHHSLNNNGEKTSDLLAPLRRPGKNMMVSPWQIIVHNNQVRGRGHMQKVSIQKISRFS